MSDVTPSGAAAAPGPDAKRALAWAHTARFLVTASQLHQLPQHALPEIAFVGRSNAGKSTAINTLTQQRRLAFASKTPGRTQHINLFELGPRQAADAVLADLPGYGYAAVERTAKLRWQEVMARYLAERPQLRGVVLLVDARHGPTELDQQLLRFVAPRVGTGEVRLLVALTKADKLSRHEAQRSLRAAEQVVGEFVTEHSDVGLLLFSSLNRIGLDDLALTLHHWAHPVA
ncbi:ribosome biogenesis GTP-binding protein YihA/YsxC [Schlegelella aquatica]|uniref:ribosome biogenesis GTP-binding protein YihA/YsxC n=1 Tax=Caldimonas aquatica TaxID=376175 RepID=UPI003750E42E